MSASPFLVTGATRGLGLAIATALARRPNTRVVIAVRNLAEGQAVAARLGPQVEARALDLASLADVRRFVAEWRGPLAGLVNNAGLQQTAGLRRTAEGLEETVGVNHLGAFALTTGLLPALEGGGRVLFIGSGTHNPDNRLAGLFGFRGARFTSVAALAAGETDAPTGQAGRDRYATSKFLNTITAVELARRFEPQRVAFFALDPGLMPGTGLARTQPRWLQFVWNRVLPVVAKALPDSSTPERSAEAAVWLLTDEQVRSRSGTVFSYDQRPSTRVWSRVADPVLGAAVVDQTRAFLDAQRG